MAPPIVVGAWSTAYLQRQHVEYYIQCAGQPTVPLGPSMEHRISKSNTPVTRHRAPSTTSPSSRNSLKTMQASCVFLSDGVPIHELVELQ